MSDKFFPLKCSDFLKTVEFYLKKKNTKEFYSIAIHLPNDDLWYASILTGIKAVERSLWTYTVLHILIFRKKIKLLQAYHSVYTTKCLNSCKSAGLGFGRDVDLSVS